MRHILTILFLLAHAGTAMACVTIEQGSPAEHALSLLEQRDYTKLEQLVQQYRGAEKFDGEGSGEIFSIYGSLTADAGCDKPPLPAKDFAVRKAELEGWAKARPASPIMLTALGSYYTVRGWAARGRGPADTVDAKQFAALDENMSQAMRILSTVAERDRDARWYVAMLNVSLAKHFPVERHVAIFQEGTAKFPVYYELYRPASEYFQGRWYGSDALYWTFADRAADIGKARGGDMFYALLHVWNDREGMYTDGHTSWPRVKAGLARRARDYPSRFNRNRYAAQACSAKDEGAMREAFAAVGKDTDEPSIWNREGRLAFCQARQHGPAECFRFENGDVTCGPPAPGR